MIEQCEICDEWHDTEETILPDGMKAKFCPEVGKNEMVIVNPSMIENPLENIGGNILLRFPNILEDGE